MQAIKITINRSDDSGALALKSVIVHSARRLDTRILGNKVAAKAMKKPEIERTEHKCGNFGFAENNLAPTIETINNAAPSVVPICLDEFVKVKAQKIMVIADMASMIVQNRFSAFRTHGSSNFVSIYVVECHTTYEIPNAPNMRGKGRQKSRIEMKISPSRVMGNPCKIRPSVNSPKKVIAALTMEMSANHIRIFFLS